MMETNSQAPKGAGHAAPFWRRLPGGRGLLAAALFLLFYTLAGFLLAPWLIQRSLPRYVEEELQHQASLGQVRINPFLLTFEATDFRLQDREGEPLFEFARLFVDFAAESLLRRAWTFADISLETPALHLLIDKEGSLNLARFIEMLPKEEEPEEKPVRLLLKHLALSQGAVHFADASGPAPVRTTFAPVTIEFNEISTLPERSGSYAVTALLPGGGRLGWQGEVSLSPLASSGSLAIEEFQPAAFWKFFQDRVNLGEPQGVARLDLSYRFSHAQGETSFLAEPVDFSLQGLAVAAGGEAGPLLRLQNLAVQGAAFDLAGRRLRLPSFSLAGLFLTAEGEKKPMLRLDSLEMLDVDCDLAGQRLHLPFVSLRGGAVAAGMDHGGVLDWQRLPAAIAWSGGKEGTPPQLPEPAGEGTGEEEKPQAPWQLSVDDFSLASLSLHYSDASRGAPFLLDIEDAALSLALEAEAGAGPARLAVRDLALRLQGINSREPAESKPLWSLAGLALAGGNLDLADRQMRAESLTLSGGVAVLVRDRAGDIRHLQVYGGRPGAAPAGAPGDAASEAAPWRVALSRLALEGFALDYADEAYRPALAYGLRDLAFSVEGFDTAGTTPLRLAARARVAQGGGLEANGTMAQNGKEAAGRIRVSLLNLTPLQPLIDEHLLLRLASGQFSLDSTLSYRAGKSSPAVKAQGSAALARLLLNEKEGGDRFLSWKELSASGIAFSLAPDRLAVREIRLVEPGAKIMIYKDRSANLGRIFREKEKEEKPPARPAAAVAAGKEAKPFPFQVERVRLEGGAVDFADLSLVLPFAARIDRFAGTALNITSDPAGRTTLQFGGQVDEFGQANVDGSLAPLDPKRFTDIRVAFRNVELIPLSSYTATFAGRRIATGRLDLDLGYRIEEGALLGDNKVLLKNFTLGERVESPSALRLPLDLAIALLTDTQGRIDVAVPVRGNVDDPEFSYGHLIWQAVLNILNRIVTAPFRALGALFGAGQQQPDTVFFAPGQAEPAPPEREKLRKVAEVLGQRPQLLLTVHGAFVRKPDGRALRDLAVRRALAQRLGAKLEADGDPGPVAFDQAKTQRTLEAMAGPATLAEFQKGFEEKAGRKARRANPALALLGRGSDDLDFYRELFARLVEKEPLAEETLQNLAGQRRDAMIRELTEKTGLAPDRVAAGGLDEAEEKEGAVPARMELGAR